MKILAFKPWGIVTLILPLQPQNSQCEKGFFAKNTPKSNSKIEYLYSSRLRNQAAFSILKIFRPPINIFGFKSG